MLGLNIVIAILVDRFSDLRQEQVSLLIVCITLTSLSVRGWVGIQTNLMILYNDTDFIGQN